LKDPFFADINWAKLEKKQIDPPIILRKSKRQNEDTLENEKIN
jgi:hypothetical protein